jgi:biopolymer transport protein ExbB
MTRLLIHSFFDFFKAGGFLMWPIFFVSVTAWMLGIHKMRFLNKFQATRKKYHFYLKELISGKDSAVNTGYKSYDELLSGIKNYISANPGTCSVKCQFTEFLMCSLPEIDNGFSSMSAWITVAPLLGLLGTVVGMVWTFRVITDFGLGNPGLTAEGISVALLTTQAGLTASFPMMLFQNHLLNRARALKSTLLMDGENLVKHSLIAREKLIMRRCQDGNNV